MEFFDSTSNNHFNSFTFDQGTSTADITSVTTNDFTLTGNVPYPNPPDVNWMPYEYVMYEPRWHKKYAAIKYQMQTMWQDNKKT